MRSPKQSCACTGATKGAVQHTCHACCVTAADPFCFFVVSILRCAALCCAVLRCAALCCAVLRCAALCCRSPVQVSKFSSDKVHILTGSDDKTVRYWDLTSEKPLHVINAAHKDHVRCASNSPANPDVRAFSLP